MAGTFSQIYSNGDSDFHTTLKGSNVYSNNRFAGDSTPSGSHVPGSMFFYKYQIPKGLFLESIEADIQKGINELKQLM